MPTSTFIVPDGGWGWVVVLVTFTQHFLGGFIYASQSILYLALQAHLGEGKSMSSWILATFTTASVVMGPIAASLGKRYSYRTVTFVGGFLLGLGAFLSFFANSVLVLILTIGVISGTGNSLCYISLITMSALYFNKKRSLAMGLGTSGVGLGTFVLPPLVTWLEEEFTWRGMLLIMSGCIFNVCALAMLLRPLAVVNTDLDEQGNEIVNYKKDEINEKTTFISYDDMVAVDVVAVEEMDVSENERFLEVVRHGGHEIGTQSLSDLTNHVVPSPAEVLYYSTLKVTSHKPIMASEIMKRNKHLSIEKDRGRSHSFNQTTSMSAENVNTTKKQQHDFSSVQDIYRKKQHSNLDITKDNQSHHLAEKDEKSLTNLSIMLMGSVYNIMAHDSKISSVLSLHSRQYINHKESHIGQDFSKHIQNKEQHNSRCYRLLGALQVYKDLMCDWRFLLMLIINFLVNLTYLAPILNLVDRATENGIEKQTAVLTLSFYGAGNTLGRIFTGVLADLKCSNRIVLYFLCLFLCGLVTGLSVFCGPYLPLHAAFGFVFGIFIGGYVVLTPLVLVDILGVEIVGQSMGLCLLFQGFSVLFGSPLAGLIVDVTGSYTIPFIAFGLCLIVSALLLLPLIYQALKGKTTLHD